MLSPDYQENFESKEEDESEAREGALKMALHFLRNMEQQDIADKLQQSKDSSFIHISIFLHQLVKIRKTTKICLSSVSVACKTLLCFILFF